MRFDANADSVSCVYLDAWARLNCQKPASVSEAEWRLALDEGGRFLDAWGSDPAEAQRTPGELFDVTAGLVWRLTEAAALAKLVSDFATVDAATAGFFPSLRAYACGSIQASPQPSQSPPLSSGGPD